MSTVQTGDTIAVYRSGTLYKAPADMSTLRNSDLIVVGRGNQSYQCTFADWKASQVGVNKPALLTPADGATDLGETPTFSSSAFSATGAVTHASSDWQVTLKTDAAFASPVVQSMADATHKLSWAGGPLQPNTDYIARVRHNGSGGLQSPWSDAIGFKTKSSFSDYLVAPGDLWVAGNTAGTGAFRTNPVKMTGVGWGDVGFAMGVDGKIYKTATLNYTNMTVLLTPPKPFTAFGVTYVGAVCIAIDTDGKIYHFDAAGTHMPIWSYSLPGGKKAVGLSYATNGDTGAFVVDEDGAVWRSNNDAISSTNYIKVTGITKQLKHVAVPSRAMGKIWGIDGSGKVWEYLLDVNTVGAVAASGEVEVTGGPFVAVRTGYSTDVAALKADGTIYPISSGLAAKYATTFPSGFEAVDLAFGYYNMFAISKDGRVLVTGANASPTGPFKAGTSSTATTWGEYNLPRPCAGFGTSKYSGSGYDFAFILP